LINLKWKFARLRVKTRSNTSRLWLRYLPSLSLIFAVLLITHQNSLSVIEAGKHHAHVINLSGQQRTLSQQILFVSERYYTNPNTEDYAKLTRHVNRFFQIHKKLSEESNISEELRTLYFGSDTTQRLDADARKFMAKALIILTGAIDSKKSIQAFTYIKDFAPSIFLEKLDIAVKYFEIAAQKDVDNLQLIQNVSLLVAACLLVLEIFFIFLPAQRSVTRSISKLERHKQSLRSARGALAAKNNELNQSYEKMEHAALHDALTGLSNRRYLEKELGERISKYSKSKGMMAVFHIDLDHFKIVNDTLGHAAGDHILRKSADIFRANARGSDFISRVGGDEFVILTDHHMTEEIATDIAERILAEFEEPIIFKGESLSVGVSIGIDVFRPQDKVGENCVSQILTHADVALYLAKENGRNRFEVFANEHYQSFIKQGAKKVK
jgi:diguanylate cyclase (GGDEF)-like protein